MSLRMNEERMKEVIFQLTENWLSVTKEIVALKIVPSYLSFVAFTRCLSTQGRLTDKAMQQSTVVSHQHSPKGIKATVKYYPYRAGGGGLGGGARNPSGRCGRGGKRRVIFSGSSDYRSHYQKNEKTRSLFCIKQYFFSKIIMQVNIFIYIQ